MFTGLIEEIGAVVEVTRGRGLRLAVQAERVLDGLKPGDSIAVSGACLTVERVTGDRFQASLLPETVAATTLGLATAGQRVNLERALRIGDRLGGHLVAGHVDGVATVTSLQQRGETRLVQLVCPDELGRYLVDNGSVALDGVSLTIRKPAGSRFSVALVGTTLKATTLGDVQAGDRLNMEADLLAKHIDKLLSARGGGEVSEELTAWLSEVQ
jgi:riboflavin synthase